MFVLSPLPRVLLLLLKERFEPCLSRSLVRTRPFLSRLIGSSCIGLHFALSLGHWDIGRQWVVGERVGHSCCLNCGAHRGLVGRSRDRILSLKPQLNGVLWTDESPVSLQFRPLERGSHRGKGG